MKSIYEQVEEMPDEFIKQSMKKVEILGANRFETYTKVREGSAWENEQKSV